MLLLYCGKLASPRPA